MIDDFRAVPPKKPVKLDTKTPAAKAEPKPPGEPTFRPPVEIEAEEERLNKAMELPPGAPRPKHGKRGILRSLFSWPPSKREYIILASLLVVIAAGAWGYLQLTAKPRPVATHTAPKVVKKEPPKPVTVPSTLTGLLVDPSVNARPVTAVMIENSIDARPQSGLKDAGVVFEAIAEGGVTRFMGVFQDTEPGNVGPIRSARPYYIQWALGFDASYAHVGGSPDGLADIKAWGVRDLDQFHNGGSYHRISSRMAPHNVYTSMAALNQLEAAKGYTSSSYSGFVRKPEAKLKQPTTTSIDMSISGPVYNVHYDYDAAANAYKRSEGGAPHLDAETGTQLEPKVVIALVVPLVNGALDSTGAYYSNYNVLGSGTAYVFQDGGVATVTWNKPDNKSQLTFTDATGKPFGLNPGQTWITALSNSSKVTYQ